MRIKDTVYVYRLIGGSKLAWHGRYHTHEAGEYELHLFLEGSGVFLQGRARYPIEGNNLFLTHPREFHSILPDELRRPLSYYALLFEPEAAKTADRELAALLAERTPPLAVASDDSDAISDDFDSVPGKHADSSDAAEPAMFPRSPPLVIEGRERFLIEELHRLTSDGKGSRSAEYLLLSLLHRWFDINNLPPPKPRRRCIAVEKALVIMARSVRSKINIEELAVRLNLSEEHFIRIFHRELGMSPFQYFTRMRIEAASSYLAESNQRVSQVAEYFGFETPFHFSRIFKKCTGLSPKEYRSVYARTPNPANLSAAEKTTNAVRNANA